MPTRRTRLELGSAATDDLDLRQNHKAIFYRCSRQRDLDAGTRVDVCEFPAFTVTFYGVTRQRQELCQVKYPNMG